jgi:hypothetical protein
MLEWVISAQDEAAYLDLRTDELAFPDAERLLGVVEPYLASRELNRLILDGRGLDPLPAAMQALLAGLKARAEAYDLDVDILSQ